MILLSPKLRRIYDSWFLDATIDEFQARMDRGELTSRELVLLYFHRIAEWNDRLKAIIEINPDALHLADALDEERKRKGKRGMLHGIPVLLKDNIGTNDKMHTSAGSLLLKDSYAKEDAFLVKKLRESGAIIIGKANMSEWGYFMALFGMPNGYSSRGGQTRNPYGPDRFDVGGSSSGSAVGVAANFVTVSVGTETSGSIINPASQNSVVGIKPTVGLISRSGIIPISHTQDTPGPIAKTVKDAVYLLVSMIGIDEKDPVTRTNPLTEKELLLALQSPTLRNIRLGVIREGYFSTLPEEKKVVVEQAINTMREHGAEIVDHLSLPSGKEKTSFDVLLHEFKVNMNAYLKNLDPPLTLTDIIAKNAADKERLLRYGQSLLEKAEQTSGTLTEKTYLRALSADYYYATENGIDALLKEYDLDALLFGQYTGAALAARAGYPSITVPAGYTAEGEPVGITFTGTKYSEAALIRIAAAFERITKARKHPPLVNGSKR